ncbi:MAG TPA: lysophospholipase [bacterium]|nr:lysophospholipase [bacterium]
MRETLVTFESRHDGAIHYHRWLPDEGMPVRRVIQIAHGMAEHAGRYRHFAEFLTRQGFAVYANDHRGHGQSVLPGEPRGFFAEAGGWQKVVDDARDLTGIAKRDHPGLPFFLFGHSMGSFVARSYAIRFGDELDGLLLSGTAGMPVLWEKWAVLAIVKFCTLVWGIRTPCTFLHNQSLRGYNRPFREPGSNSQYHWLSRDPAVAHAFDADPLCGGIFPAAFFRDLADGILFMSDPAGIAQMPKALPVFFLSGDRDPVGRNGAGVREAHQLFIDAGMNKVTLKLYPEARHEPLNELNRDVVYGDILAWLSAQEKKG